MGDVTPEEERPSRLSRLPSLPTPMPDVRRPSSSLREVLSSPRPEPSREPPSRPCRPYSRLTDPPSSEYITVLLLTIISKMLEARCAAPLPVHLDLLCPNKMLFCLNPN